MKKSIALVLAVCLATGFAYAEKTKIRWFVGLGAGSDEPTLAAQKAVVDRFNKSQDEIQLTLEIVTSSNAPSTLSTEIAGGNAPDVVGPVGIKGRDSFKGAWLDLEPLVQKANYDLTQYDKAMVDFYRTKDEGLVGLPFAIYPSFLHVNKALFKEAGLPLPPTKYGDPYIDENGNKLPWDMNTVKMLSKKLTVDANGNDATSPKFDSSKIVQFGFGLQYSDARGFGTLFGPGSFVASDGKSAQIPKNWAAAFQFYQDAMWKDWWIPNGPYSGSDTFNKGDLFASNKVAMVPIHLWYDGFASLQKMDFDFYPIPAAPGSKAVTAKMHADTFEVSRYSKNPEAAFKVLTYLMTTAAPDLLKIYGGMPAKTSAQAPFLDDFLSAKFPGKRLNKAVVIASIAYADNPNHESFMPSFQEATTIYGDFWNNLTNTPKTNLATALPKLQADLDKVFKAAKP
jgi:multiple sugar transport system substrate-binding protein